MSKPAAKNGNRIIHIRMTALTVVLIVLVFNILSLVADIQGTARCRKRCTWTRPRVCRTRTNARKS